MKRPNQKTARRSPFPVPRSAPHAAPITLADLNAVCHQWVDVVLALEELPSRLADAAQARPKEVAIRCRRLTPAEDARVNLLAQQCLPPMKPARGKDGKPDPDAPPEMDFADADWQARRQTMELTARAVALYLGVPIFHEARPELRTAPAAEICAFIQDQATEDVLNRLKAVVTGGALRAAEVAGSF